MMARPDWLDGYCAKSEQSVPFIMNVFACQNGHGCGAIWWVEDPAPCECGEPWTKIATTTPGGGFRMEHTVQVPSQEQSS